MYIYLSKILPNLLMPLSLVFIFLAVFFLMRQAQKQRIAIFFIVMAVLVLWVASTPLVAQHLYGKLETYFPAESLTRLSASPCAVVLGGAIASQVSSESQVVLGEAADRGFTAARLYLMGKVEKILVTAGNQPWSRQGPSEAELVGELLVEWGVPVQALRLEGESRNTRENALNSLPILKELECERPLLVTSAAHMPRALASFRVLGVDAIPVSTDVRVIDSGRISFMEFFPDAHALAMTSDAIREWMGQKVYEWKGWN